MFSAAEAVEFAAPNQLTIAAERYRILTSAADPQVRAGAWFRLARVLRKSGRFIEALAAYQPDDERRALICFLKALSGTVDDGVQ